MDKLVQVRALFNYERQHTDELSFHIGDIITITQMLDGGWWEGTLGEITAWFPSNYVEIVKDHGNGESTYDDLPCEEAQKDGEYLTNFQTEILHHILEGEMKLCFELMNVQQALVVNLESMHNIPFQSKIGRLKECIHNLNSVHQSLVSNLEELKVSSETRRVGKLYLSMAPSISSAYREYSSLHLYIATGLEKYKSAVQAHFESRSMAFNLAKVIQQLSMPFERLGRYSLLLKELERYYEDSHPDRGDIQRAVVVLNEINEECLEVRKMKERDLDILYASILGWKGERLSQLGDPLYTERVGNSSASSNPDSFDHVLVVFPSCVLLLACTDQADVYAYKCKISVDGLEIALRENTSFELCSGLTGECLSLMCADEARRDKILSIIQQTVDQSSNPPAQGQMQGNQESSADPSHAQHLHHQQQFSQQQQVSNNSVHPHHHPQNPPQYSIQHASMTVNTSPHSQQQQQQPHSTPSPQYNQHHHHSPSSQQQHHHQVLNQHSIPYGVHSNQPTNMGVTMRAPKRTPLLSLRPDPPVLSAKEELARQQGSGGRARSPGPRGHAGGRLARKKSDRQKSAINSEELDRSLGKMQDSARRVQDDSLILQVIEAYCSANQSKHASKSLDLAKLRLSDAEIRRVRGSHITGPAISATIASSLPASRDLEAISHSLPPPPPPPPASNGTTPYHSAVQSSAPSGNPPAPPVTSRGFAPLHQVPMSSHHHLHQQQMLQSHHHQQQGQLGHHHQQQQQQQMQNQPIFLPQYLAQQQQHQYHHYQNIPPTASIMSSVVPPPAILPTRAGRKM